MVDETNLELSQRVEFHHGRKTTARPLGTDGLLFVLYSGDGPLPDYDIAGWVNDAPIGGGEVRRVKISRDFAHVADALFQLERELTAKTVSRGRGSITMIEDQETKRWALWLETWQDYFDRSHILKSPEMVEAQKAASKVESDRALAERLEQQHQERDAYLAKPTAKIFLAVLGLIVLWQIVRLFL